MNSGRHLLFRFLGAVAVAAILILGALQYRSQRSVEAFSGVSMGTTYSIKVIAESASRPLLQELITKTLDRVDRLMSTYKEDSELSRFNRHESTAGFSLSPETFAVFSKALEVSSATSGAFDVTIGPLVNAWGFGPGGRKQAEPSAEEIDRLLAGVGYRHLRIDAKAGNLIFKENPEIACDLSGIAEGYVVGAIGEVFDEAGYRDYLIEVGGEVWARGRGPHGAWRIGVEKPDTADRTILEVVALKNLGLATSGDYRNFYEKDGVRLSHTIDPRTGRPIKHALASVTVIHQDPSLADAYATALNVLGPSEGYEFAQKAGLRAFFIVRTLEGGFESKATPGFRELVVSR